MIKEKDLKIFQNYLPATAVQYSVGLWLENKFNFKVTKPRASKLGDYCYQPGQGHSITVNSNLNKYSFLITYLHEIAHLHVQKASFRRKAPHGKEWKSAFRQLLLPVMSLEVFPLPVLKALEVYIKNPTASTGTHSMLANSLLLYDTLAEGKILLSTIAETHLFSLNGRIFEKGPLRRTRFLCKDKKSGRNYIILGRALVEKV
jgi:SprT protein